MVRVTFYFNNREAKRELKIYNSIKLSQFSPVPTYYGVKLDRSLILRHHFVTLQKKYLLASHCYGDLRRWAAGPKHGIEAALSLQLYRSCIEATRQLYTARQSGVS